MPDVPQVAERKADFGAFYSRPDPRELFRALAPLEYQVPQRALPLLRRVLAASAVRGRPRTVLDVCCSYGINAALLRYDVDFAGLTGRYATVADLPVSELRRADRAYYAARLAHPDLTVLGLDAAAPAISYAVDVGLLSGGWAEDLESVGPSAALAAGLRDVGLVVCTGGVGYVGHRTFERILDAVDAPGDLWLVMFVLRVFPFEEIAASLARYGLVTERVPGWTVRQRRFVNDAERAAAVHDVRERGLDPAAMESDGWYHADCYLTRPAAAVARQSLADLLPPV